MTVNMPVEVFNERCIHCPDLEVDTITKENFIIKGIDENGKFDQVNECTNQLRCIHCDSCKARYEAVFKPDQKDIPAKAAKKKTGAKTISRKEHSSK